jgi:hypothetical protein
VDYLASVSLRFSFPRRIGTHDSIATEPLSAPCEAVDAIQILHRLVRVMIHDFINEDSFHGEFGILVGRWPGRVRGDIKFNISDGPLTIIRPYVADRLDILEFVQFGNIAEVVFVRSPPWRIPRTAARIDDSYEAQIRMRRDTADESAGNSRRYGLLTHRRGDPTPRGGGRCTVGAE